MANRVLLKKAESHAQQDVWTTIQKIKLQWKRPLLLLVTRNPWKHHPVPKATSCANPNTFYQGLDLESSICLKRSVIPPVMFGCLAAAFLRPLAILWLQGIHHQTDRWIPCSKLRISYPARVTRRWCVKMPLRNNKHIGNLVIEISSSSSSSSSKKNNHNHDVEPQTHKTTILLLGYKKMISWMGSGIIIGHRILAPTSWPFGGKGPPVIPPLKKRLPKFGTLRATENHPKMPCSFFFETGNQFKSKVIRKSIIWLPHRRKVYGNFSLWEVWETCIS